MKFQNSSIHGFKVMLCIKKRDERTDGRTDEQPRSNMPLQLLRSWGHNNNWNVLKVNGKLERKCSVSMMHE